MDPKYKPIDPETWQSVIPAFEEETLKFANGDLNKKDYKGFSGKYGSYAQRDGKSHMLRLRMTGGRMTREKLKFALDEIRKHDIDPVHFTTCQTLQLHNLQPDQVFDIMKGALGANIVFYGGGGDYPRNVMATPLAGTDKDEYFDVMPYVQAAAEFLMHFIDTEKMPRKLKVGFSGCDKDLPHVTFRDLGFQATPEGKFDVYAAGGLGNVPKLGVKVAEGIDPADICYYIVAMIETFKKYGNYQNRSKARTRFMQDALGGPEAFREKFTEELERVKAGEDLTLDVLPDTAITKTGDGSVVEESWRVKAQKQPGLYSVLWHPAGGTPDRHVFENLAEAVLAMDQVELRISPDESVYIINLTGGEAKKVLDIIDSDTAHVPFETSIACIGASICQVGLRDSQDMLAKIQAAVSEAGVGAYLPQLHISGCPSSCGSHQVGEIGFRGGIKMVDKKPVPAFNLFLYGSDKLGAEALGKDMGPMAIDDIPAFVVKLGQIVKESGQDWETWHAKNPEGIEAAALEYLA